MSEGSPRRARRWRYLGYAAGALLGVVVLLVLGSWLAVRIWGPEFARERLEIALSSALERPTTVDSVSVQPWLGRVVIGNVTAAARPGEPGPHFLKLSRLEINLSVQSIWRRGLALRSIRLDDLDLAIGEQYLSYEPYGFMLRRGDSPFRLAVNRVLSSLYRSREVMQIYGRWFGKLGEPGNLLIAMYALHALPE